MSFKYQNIFFDLDHTLWDYDANSKLTLNEMFEEFDLPYVGLSSSKAFHDEFIRINEDLWAKYNVGKISKFYLRDERFRLVFEAAGADMELVEEDLLMQFNKTYLRQCPHKPKLIDGAKEILAYLKPNYRLHIITNGFEEIQTIKLQSGGIDHFFEKIITSEKAGFKKPFSGMFRYAMKHCKAEPDTSIMIGDNLNTDIKGARGYDIDQVFFNPERVRHDEDVTHEITHLAQLENIL